METKTKQHIEDEIQSQVTGTERDEGLYKRDTFVQALVDRRYLATAAEVLEKEKEMRVGSMSELIGDIVEAFALMVVGNSMVEGFSLTSEAESFLSARLKGSLNKGERGSKSLWYNKRVDSVRISRVSAEKGADRSGSAFIREGIERKSDKLDKEMEEAIKNNPHGLKPRQSNSTEEDNRPRSEMSDEEIKRKDQEELKEQKDQLAVPPKPSEEEE